MELSCRRRVTSTFLWTAVILCSAILLCKSSAVNITKVEIPPLVEFGVNESIILDCDYELGNSSAGLVVKWYFDSSLIYQWIFPLEPQELSILKGKLDLHYRASTDPLKARRALRIMDPGLTMSGSYKCCVSTYEGEVSSTGDMLIFSGEHNMQISIGSNDEENEPLLVVCTVEDVYPRPKLVIKRFHTEISDQNETVTNDSHGLYAAEARALVPRPLAEREQFLCELELPQANYTAKRIRIVYKAVVTETTVEPPTTTMDQSITGNFTSDGATKTQVGVVSLLLLTFTVIASLC